MTRRRRALHDEDLDVAGRELDRRRDRHSGDRLDPHAAPTGLDASEDLHELLGRATLPTGDRPAPPVGTVELRGVTSTRSGRWRKTGA